MDNLKSILVFNGTTLSISLTEVEQYLQIAVLSLSTIITLIASIKKALADSKSKKDNSNNGQKK